MPKVTAAHEEASRRRIAEAAVRALSKRGLRDTTIQDVVRESGLSVGAIYTYFQGRDDLLVAGCELMLAQELEALAGRLATVDTVRDRLALAVTFWFDFLETGADRALFLDLWLVARSQPRVREMLVRRRERLVAVGVMLLQDGIARGELSRDLDVDAIARGFSALLEGLVLQAIEEGDDYRRRATERRALAFLDVLLAKTTAGAV